MEDPVVDYYRAANEALRHAQNPFGAIQEQRTKELLTQWLARKEMAVLDVGGATGVYSFFLADLGHRVSLLDVAPNHVSKVEELNAQRSRKLEGVFLGDVQTFDATAEYDAIILHGPLYHITDRKKRIAVLERVAGWVSPTGIILGFAISRYAGYFYGVRSGDILDDAYRRIVSEEMKTGLRRRAPGWYFHKPDELRAEYEEAGLAVIGMKSVTTQVWMLPQVEEMVGTADGMETLLSLAREAEDHLEVGQDLLCVGSAGGEPNQRVGLSEQS